ncbi:glycoside hydrolase [Kockovaella imperatae]|uniref:Mannosyl-oligosaccharide glucosidase n=1 Tax=Kockovaella imperatae TaxID=4999 RepID=A0A1Y1UI45_9TREE|nr:glycoside hydrolase [Kockovaella imperatae]ORX37718.1 glycoside hydrolase [Kockovaella imperatae]
MRLVQSLWLGALALLPSYVLAENEIGQQAALLANQSLFWNTYRPQLYHGIRARTPHSLMTGLMWFGLNDFNGLTSVRYTCEQSDDLDSYSYTEHDGRYYAVQEITDSKNNVRMKISWLKSEDGTDWSVRVEGEPLNPSARGRVSLIYHVGLEGLGELELETAPDEQGLEGQVVLKGRTSQLGKYRLRLVDHPEVSHARVAVYANDHGDLEGKTSFVGLPIPTGQVWRIKDTLLQKIGTFAQNLMTEGGYSREAPPDPVALFRLPNDVAVGSNVFAFQKAFGGHPGEETTRWGFDLFFENVDGNDEGGMTFAGLSQSLSQASRAYNQRFDSTFHLPSPFNSDAHRDFAKALTSNIVGGIGYYQGASIVDRSFKHDYDDDVDDDEDENHDVQAPKLTEERELLTATPSRSFFPRGFYWDEGFHLALIGEWDNDLSLEILKDWIALIDEDGWVAREQILGDESRSKVPQEFWTQYPTYANPPTLTMAVTAFIHRLRRQNEDSQMDSAIGVNVPSSKFSPSSPSSSLPSLHIKTPFLARSFLQSIYPSLRTHYQWFRRTQRGLLRPYGRSPTSKSEAYRWRGRTENHVLTSGLDDYPRARPPHSGELHVDLMSWMGFFARTMGEISEYLGLEEDREEYAKHERGILANLDDLHWSEEHQMYCDVSVNDEDESYHVCNPGYISLFPFLLGLIPADSPHLKPTLDLITDPKQLWSPYGIRSLSKSHELFGKDENYWRGPIWIQMNWLALKALKERYMVEEGSQKERSEKIYDDLRKNVVDNVFKEWKRTGYSWEQYDAETGEGRRSHPFTGWTSLVTMIMTEKFS